MQEALDNAKKVAGGYRPSATDDIDGDEIE